MCGVAVDIYQYKCEVAQALRWLKPQYVGGHALDGEPRGHSILADQAGYGNSSGTVQFLVVTKDDIGESRLALDGCSDDFYDSDGNYDVSCSGVPSTWGSGDE